MHQSNALNMLQALMGVAQQNQQLQQGQQQLDQGPEEFDMKRQMQEAQMQRLGNENELAPYQLEEAQFQQEHRPEQFEAQALQAKLHGLGSLGQSGLLMGPGAPDQTQMKLLLHKLLGLDPGDPVGEETDRRMKATFGSETAIFDRLNQGNSLMQH